MPQQTAKKNGRAARILDALTVSVTAFAVAYTNLLLFTGLFEIPTKDMRSTHVIARLLDAVGLNGNAFRGIRITESRIPVLPILLLALTVLSVAVSLLPKPGWWYLGLSLAGIGWIVWKRTLLAAEFHDLFGYLMRRGSFRQLFPAALRGFRLSHVTTDSQGEALLLVGLALALLTAFLLMRRRNSLWFSVLNVTAVAALCVVMQTDPPSLPFLFLLAAHIVLILVSLMRRRDPLSARRILFVFMVPATAFCLLCGYVGSRYERPVWADTAVRRILDFADSRLHSQGKNNGGTRSSNAVAEAIGAYVWNSNPSLIYLSYVGPQTYSEVPAMEIYSDTTRTYYLRGMSYGWYDGSRWIQWEEMPGVRADSLITPSAPEEQLLIRTARPTGILYLPYTPTELPAGSFPHYDQYVSVQKKISDYTVLFKPNAYYAPVSPEYYNALDPAYTMVLDTTAEELADIVSRFDPEDPNVVFEVANYVRNSATYDLDTERMPAGGDFVAWFLKYSDTGYCVHFASAATVLLRMLGIPARYVTGYMAHAVGGQWTTVTQGDAHAWVEYFDESNASWRMLEVTSSVEVAEEEDSTPAVPTAPLPNLRGDDDPTAPRERDDPAPADVNAPRGRRIPLAAAILIPALLAAAAWPLIMKAIRRADFRRGDRNRQLLARYRYAVWLAGAMDREVPAKVRDTALRARFSNHPSTEEDLALVTSAADALTAERRKTSNPLRWIWVRYFLAI
ncbi:MAG: transglutaminase-like domain-containing protein [Clostridiales bacterium]|nr:transglutaminase-like domain-containing protein [Clostridiales bacterium]